MGKEIRCSFCGKDRSEVRVIIAGPSVYICDECVQVCVLMLREERKQPKREHVQLWFSCLGDCTDTPADAVLAGLPLNASLADLAYEMMTLDVRENRARRRTSWEQAIAEKETALRARGRWSEDDVLVDEIKDLKRRVSELDSDT